MRWHSAIAALGLAGFLMPAPPARAQAGTDRKPDVVEGEVVRVDTARSRVTVRGDDGATFEFTAGPETLKDLEPGDRIEAKRRATER